jgi:hypothetical protein
MAGRKTFMRPANDSFEAYRQFIVDMVHALSPCATVDLPDSEYRASYEAYLAARRKSGEPLDFGGGAETTPAE